MPVPPAFVRRCTGLFVERRERLDFDPLRLLQGESGLLTVGESVALVPHRSAEVVLSEDEAVALDAVARDAWQLRDEIGATMGDACLQSLLTKGVLVQQGTPDSARDECIRDACWHPLSAAAHVFSRWSGTDSIAAQREARLHSVDDMIEVGGVPPGHFHARPDAQARVPLSRPPSNDLDALMARRATCRNFDPAAAIPPHDLGAILHRSFGMQGSEELAPGAVALKKNHPSGGGLHPLEAYAIVQRADGIAPGLYHYNVEAHALDLLRGLVADEARALALTAVAGQDYFAEAPVMLVVAARFARSFWKYRRHPKIYRAIVLETGHVSQSLYLAATELGMGAYITAAINEVEIEQAFGLDPLLEGPLAVCGFGPRARRRETVELDPAHRVWDERGDLVRASAAGSRHPDAHG